MDGLQSAARRVAASHGLDLFDLQFRRESPGWVLRVVIDRRWSPEDGPEPADPEVAVGIEECQRVSHDLSALLDVEDELVPVPAESYTLEVSSPGLDRPLREEADYRRFEGRVAKIVTAEPVERQTAFAGRLSGIDQGHVLLTEGKRVHRVPLALIRRAKLEVEF